jgi:hypothetical protein
MYLFLLQGLAIAGFVSFPLLDDYDHLTDFLYV